MQRQRENPFLPLIPVFSERWRTIASGVRCLLAPNPGKMTGPGTNTYVLGKHQFIVVDPGPAHEGHLQSIVKACPAGTIKAIWLTHAHPDHACGVPRLMELTGAALLAFPVPSPTYPIDGLPAPDLPAVDGGKLRWEGDTWEVLHTPGHASDHLCFHRLEDAAILTGDLIVGEGTVVIAPPDGDMQAYFASLKRLQALMPQHLWPGHGDPIYPADRKIAAYLTHREARENQILAALREHPGTRHEALTATLYSQIDQALLPMAARQVLAHLLKLAAEGKVRQNSTDTWQSLESSATHQ